MCIRYFGFVLLIWFPGALHGQSAPQSCSVPSLDRGFFTPKLETYPHGAQLAYTCDTGRKPTVKGWWATSTCQNGKWSHEPQCIDEKSCIPPTIPNAKYTENSNGWYEEGHRIRITCAKGYQHKNRDATAECQNGTWSSVPVCEKSPEACGTPPKILHALIVNQEYQDVFAVDSEVQYKCEDGFTVEGADTILCIAGNWTSGPSCSNRPQGGQGGSAGGGGRDNTCGGHSTSAGCVPQPAARVPQPAGAGRGSSTSSRGNEREGGTQITTVDKCGRIPTVSNGDVVETNYLFLKYQCSAFYKRVGPQKVVCYMDGTWSKVPTCKDTFCSVDTAEYPHLKNVGVEFINDGGEARFECVKLKYQLFDHYSLGRCTDGRVRFGTCCSWWKRNTGC